MTLNDPAQPEGSNIDPAASDKGTAFKQLAGFLGKKNEPGQGLSMTTPVFSKSKQGVMQFYIGEGYEVCHCQDAQLLATVISHQQHQY